MSAHPAVIVDDLLTRLVGGRPQVGVRVVVGGFVLIKMLATGPGRGSSINVQARGRAKVQVQVHTGRGQNRGRRR
ncbi:hypothetical protein [Streptomyces sp. NBC_00076]|uniref:hypothetical protein n=1 Tax=Streptomyces sp. NBC_00076 TaxID=2975642 RepID=UPI003863A12A